MTSIVVLECLFKCFDLFLFIPRLTRIEGFTFNFSKNLNHFSLYCICIPTDNVTKDFFMFLGDIEMEH